LEEMIISLVITNSPGSGLPAPGSGPDGFRPEADRARSLKAEA